MSIAATRRALLKAASVFASLLLAPASLLRGQAAVPAPTPAPTPASPAGEGPKGLAAIARERYGKFLAPEELGLLDEEMASLERRSGRLRAIRLANSEEPATDFRTLRG